MALFLTQDITAVGKIPLSELNEMYQSETFKTWKQVRDNTMKFPGVIVERLDGLAKQISTLSTVLSRRR